VVANTHNQVGRIRETLFGVMVVATILVTDWRMKTKLHFRKSWRKRLWFHFANRVV
jgi:hypothetical protein